MVRSEREYTGEFDKRRNKKIMRQVDYHRFFAYLQLQRIVAYLVLLELLKRRTEFANTEGEGSGTQNFSDDYYTQRSLPQFQDSVILACLPAGLSEEFTTDRNLHELRLTKVYESNQPTPAPLPRGDFQDNDTEKNLIVDGQAYDLGYNQRDVVYNAELMPRQINMVKADNTSQTIDIMYDPDSARAKKTSPTNTTFYIGGYLEKINGELTAYVFNGNLRIAKVSSSGTYFYHKDHLGSTLAMTDSSGNVVETLNYTPYGEDREHTYTNGSVTSYLFTDQEYDPEIGLYNYDARLYDPVIGRFVSPDTLVPDYSDPQSLNRYSYVKNNPLRFTDPTGHYFWDSLFGPDDGASGNTSVNTSSNSESALGNNAVNLSNAVYRTSDYASNFITLGLYGMAQNEYSNGNYATGTCYYISGIALGVVNVATLGGASYISQMSTNSLRALPTASTANKTLAIGYHATTPEAAKSIIKNGFQLGTKPGRLGSGGVYVNNTIKGATKEFRMPGIKPAIIEVQYDVGVNAMAQTIPRYYVNQLPLNVSTISAQSLRLLGTTSTIILNNSANPLRILK